LGFSLATFRDFSVVVDTFSLSFEKETFMPFQETDEDENLPMQNVLFSDQRRVYSFNYGSPILSLP